MRQFFVLLAASTLGLAPALVAQDAPPGSPFATVTRPLAKDDFVRSVVVRNPQVGEQQMEVRISEWGIRAEKGMFEPVFVVTLKEDQGERENTTEQNVSQLFVNQTGLFLHENTLNSAGIAGLLPSGANYNIGYSVSRLQNTLNRFSSEYVAFTGVELTQPLLRNFGRTVTEAPVRLAQKAYEIRLQELRKRLIEIVLQAEGTYWDFALKHEQVRMRRESLERAETLLKDFRERSRAGKVSVLEVDQAETGLLLRRSQLQSAQEEFLTEVNRIRALLNQSAVEADAVLVPVQPPVFEPVETDALQSLSAALQKHPDYLVSLLMVEQEDIRIDQARNEARPQLDLVGSYGLNAYGSTGSLAYEDISRRDYEAWTVGIEFRTGLLGNVRGRSLYQASLLRKDQRLATVSDNRAKLSSLISTVVGRIESLEQRALTLQDVVAYNRKVLDVSLARLREGKDDIRRVLEIEEDLVEAEDARLTAYAEFQKAALELEGLEGTLLDNRNIDVSGLLAN